VRERGLLFAMISYRDTCGPKPLQHPYILLPLHNIVRFFSIFQVLCAIKKLSRQPYWWGGSVAKSWLLFLQSEMLVIGTMVVEKCVKETGLIHGGVDA
jgi:hypothetical protein